MLSLEEVQDQIIADLDAAFVQNVVEQAIPNTATVLRDTAGKITPYLAIQFGDIREGSNHNMATPWGDDYVLPVYVQSVAGVPKIARQLANKAVRVLLAKDYEWSGSVRKRPGGGMWPIVQTDGSTEAYMMPASFAVTVQMHYES